MTPACWGWQLRYEMVCPGPPLLLRALLTTFNTHYNRKQRLGETELNKEMGSTVGSLIPKSVCLSCKLQPLKENMQQAGAALGQLSWSHQASGMPSSISLLPYLLHQSISTWLPTALRTFFHITNLRPTSWQSPWSTSRLTVTQSVTVAWGDHLSQRTGTAKCSSGKQLGFFGVHLNGKDIFVFMYCQNSHNGTFIFLNCLNFRLAMLFTGSYHIEKIQNNWEITRSFIC